MKIAFILPTYNEEKNLKKLILRIKDYLNNLDYKLYFFIINDGSQISSILLMRLKIRHR